MRIRIDKENEKVFPQVAKHFRERMPNASDNQIANALLQEAMAGVLRVMKNPGIILSTDFGNPMIDAKTGKMRRK
jgi:hypothetical protein